MTRHRPCSSGFLRIEYSVLFLRILRKQIPCLEHGRAAGAWYFQQALGRRLTGKLWEYWRCAMSSAEHHLSEIRAIAESFAVKPEACVKRWIASGEWQIQILTTRILALCIFPKMWPGRVHQRVKAWVRDGLTVEIFQSLLETASGKTTPNDHMRLTLLHNQWYGEAVNHNIQGLSAKMRDVQ